MAAKKKRKDFDTSAVLDGFAITNEEPLAERSKTLCEFVKANDTGNFSVSHNTKLKDLKGGKELALGSGDELAVVIETLVHHLARIDKVVKRFRAIELENSYVWHAPEWDKIWGPRSILLIATRDLLRKKLPLTAAHAAQIADWIAAADNVNVHTYPMSGIVKAIENIHTETPLDGDASAAVEKMLANIKREWDQKPLRKFVERLENILGTSPEIPLEAGEAWSDAALADLAALTDSKATAWVELLKHCQSASQGKPSKKWLKAAESLMETVGRAPFCERILHWFPVVDKPRTEEIDSWSEWEPDPNLMLSDQNADTLKGLIWCSSLLEHAAIARALTALAISAYRKVPGIGPRAVKVGNACVYALGALAGMDGVGQLAILKVRVKFGTAQKGIEKALVATAERVGIARDELEEMSVPSYGLSSVGLRTEAFEDFTANLQVTSRKPELLWFRPDGKQQKSIPAVVKNDFAEELKELKQAAKDIEKMVPAQVARIEQTYLLQKDWPYATWVERYLDHALVGTITRRLIWSFQRGTNRVSAIWTADGFVDSRNNSVDWPDSNTTVRLWHPLEETDTEQVTAWRDWLLDHEIQQPFKQAHREVYILTDAERNTDVYSNRFAAHVLKQHQFNAYAVLGDGKTHFD